ncbi:hypothetical protein V6N13_023710 [Hibiscus sabdariffa]|uniref:Uncharacterized protein n=1 Tax=Hibiscus sabdariffa TaxID=183260 RepID=A0ABR2PN12_9ROSI
MQSPTPGNSKGVKQEPFQLAKESVDDASLGIVRYDMLCRVCSSATATTAIVWLWFLCVWPFLVVLAFLSFFLHFGLVLLDPSMTFTISFSLRYCDWEWIYGGEAEEKPYCNLAATMVNGHGE